MKKSSWPFALLLTCCWSLFSYAQNAPVHPQVGLSHAQYLGKTPPLRNLTPAAPTAREKRDASKKLKTVPNFAGRRGQPYEPKPGALPKGGDPVRQSSLTENLQILVEPIVNTEGMSQDFSGSIPPDPCGDMGGEYYVQMVNASFFQIFDKEGNPAGAPIAANTIWTQVGFSSFGDPIILFDQEANRWILTEFSPNNRLLFAISESGDPLGAWDAYAFATPFFPDYPKYAVWPNAYCVTTNEGGADQVEVYFINRQQILSGAANPVIQRITLPGVTGGPGFYVATPVDWTGASAPPSDAKPKILCLRDDAWASVAQDGIDVFEVDIDWNTPANTTYTLSQVFTAPFDTHPCSASGFGWACIPQLGGDGIDGLPEVIMHQAHYRNFGSYEVMVLNFIADATAGNNVSGIRWMELRKTGTEAWYVFQEGTFAPDDGLHRFMGSIAMDGEGNIGLAYSVSSASSYPGLRFTGRLASDPPGVMTVQEFEIAAGFSASPFDRYGDYAQLTVDPSNDRTFWFTGEYLKPDNKWGTRIVAFELRKDTNDIGPQALLAPLNSPDLENAETVTFSVKNFGLDSQFVFQVGYLFENGAPVVDDVNVALAPDSVYTHTFSQTVDMQAVGAYHFTLFTKLPADGVTLNDTLRVVRSKLPRFDAGIAAIQGLGATMGCADSVLLGLELVNYGTEILESVDIQVVLNGSLSQTLNWSGVLPSGASELVNIVLTGMVSGNNELVISTQNPNGMIDEIPVNDGLTRTFKAIENGVQISLAVKTDDWPAETTWEVRDLDGDLWYAGGPYDVALTVYQESLCLDPQMCYQFTIFDAYGDGICCEYGHGLYYIQDTSGIMLLTGDGIFGFSMTHDFCAWYDCLLEAGVSVSAESADGAADGAILISAASGVGPLQYSIDGGQNFQYENLFEGLSAGEYDIVVEDSIGCQITQEAEVGVQPNSVRDLRFGHIVEVLPNPTDGLFRLNVKGLVKTSPFLDIQILDARGQVVQYGNLVNYNGIFTGEVSLYARPAGVYYVRFLDPQVRVMARVVKQ